MSDVAPGTNGAHASKAEHDTLRERVDHIFTEQKSQGDTLKFIEQQMRLFGQATELLLAEHGLDMPESEDA